MRLLKFASVLVALAGLGIVALVYVAPSVRAQSRAEKQTFGVAMSGGRLGVSARDLDAAEAERRKISGGALIEDVRADSPASRGGLKPMDVVVEFDGEHVRSARQFSRLVQETPAGRSVKATIVRDGQRMDLQLTPSDDHGREVFIDRDQLRDKIDGMVANMPAFDFDFDFDVPGMSPRARLGVTVQKLSDQLGDYFGAKDGLLVTSVAEGSAAEKAGVKAGDVIMSINGTRVDTPSELTRALRDADASADIRVGIVRDKKESSITMRLESHQPRTSRSRSAI